MKIMHQTKILPPSTTFNNDSPVKTEENISVKTLERFIRSVSYTVILFCYVSRRRMIASGRQIYMYMYIQL